MYQLIRHSSLSTSCIVSLNQPTSISLTTLTLTQLLGLHQNRHEEWVSNHNVGITSQRLISFFPISLLPSTYQQGVYGLITWNPYIQRSCLQQAGHIHKADCFRLLQVLHQASNPVHSPWTYFRCISLQSIGLFCPF